MTALAESFTRRDCLVLFRTACTLGNIFGKFFYVLMSPVFSDNLEKRSSSIMIMLLNLYSSIVARKTNQSRREAARAPPAARSLGWWQHQPGCWPPRRRGDGHGDSDGGCRSQQCDVPLSWWTSGSRGSLGTAPRQEGAVPAVRQGEATSTGTAGGEAESCREKQGSGSSSSRLVPSRLWQ